MVVFRVLDARMFHQSFLDDALKFKILSYVPVGLTEKKKKHFVSGIRTADLYISILSFPLHQHVYTT